MYVVDHGDDDCIKRLTGSNLWRESLCNSNARASDEGRTVVGVPFAEFIKPKNTGTVARYLARMGFSRERFVMSLELTNSWTGFPEIFVETVGVVFRFSLFATWSSVRDSSA